MLHAVRGTPGKKKIYFSASIAWELLSIWEISLKFFKYPMKDNSAVSLSSLEGITRKESVHTLLVIHSLKLILCFSQDTL